MNDHRRGFTILELLVVMTILALLAGLAMPKYHELRNRATATEAIGALGVIRHAAFAYNEASGQWAPGTSTGIVPAELVQYLPDGFGFRQPEFDLAWSHSSWMSGTQQQSAQMVQLFTRDPAVCDQVSHLLGGSANPQILSLCDGGNGTIILYVES